MAVKKTVNAEPERENYRAVSVSPLQLKIKAPTIEQPYSTLLNCICTVIDPFISLASS